MALALSASAFMVPAPPAHAAARARAPAMQGGPISLPDPVKDILRDNDLKDPSEFSQGEFDTYLAGSGAGFFILFLLPLFPSGIPDLILSLLFGGLPLAYTQLRKDEIGSATGQVGEYTMKAVDFVSEKEKEFKVTETIKAKIEELKKDLL